jgi:hypothetical protein
MIGARSGQDRVLLSSAGDDYEMANALYTNPVVHNNPASQIWLLALADEMIE